MSRRSLLTAVGLLAVLVTGTGCQIGLSATYLGSSKYGTLAVAPADWEVYDAESMLGQAGALPFLQGFGAGGNDPAWPIGHIRPGGVLTVTAAPDLAAAAKAAEDALFNDLDSVVASGEVSIIEHSQAIGDERWEQERWILEVSTQQGTVIRVIQKTMTGLLPLKREDGSVFHPVKSLMVGCQLECFAAERDTLEAIVESWEVS